MHDRTPLKKVTFTINDTNFFHSALNNGADIIMS